MQRQIVDLQGVVKSLERDLLPNPKETGNYSKSEEARILGFRLLAYAQIEKFLEDWALEVTDMLIMSHNNGQLSAYHRRHILMHRQMRSTYPPRSIREPDVKDVKNIINSFLKEHAEVIDGNNGASEKDVLKLFIPLGVTFSWFESQDMWLDSLNAITRSRGAVAHGATSVGSSTAPTPEGEVNSLDRPIAGLHQLEQELTRILRLP